MPAVTPPPLLAAAAHANSLASVFVWSGVLIALVLVAFAGYSYLRRWMRGDDSASGPPRGFTLAELRDLHRRGEMSDAEYEATKSQLIGVAKRAADAMPPVLQRPANPPGRRRGTGDGSAPP